VADETVVADDAGAVDDDTAVVLDGEPATDDGGGTNADAE
jgi:hypothetical protein